MEMARKKQRASDVEGMERDRLVRRVYRKEITGRKPKGRPRKSWTDNSN